MNRRNPRREVPAYIFAAAKAGEMQQRRNGKERKSTALPLSLDELQKKLKGIAKDPSKSGS